MRAFGVCPDHFTVPLVVSACSELTLLSFGSIIHGDCIKFGFLGLGSSAAGSSIVHMYFRCESLEDALKLFEEMPERDVIPWTTVIVGCAINGYPGLSMDYLRDMNRSSMKMNSRTIIAGLKACSSIDALKEGMCLHSLAVKLGVWDSDSVKTSTLSLYSSCGCLDETWAVSRELNSKDLVSWTEVLSCYAKLGRVRDCASLFSSMVDAGRKPDGIAVSCLLSSISTDIIVGGALHGFLLRRDLLSEKSGVIAVIKMYCKLNLSAKAVTILNMIGDKDGEFWTVILSSLAKVESSALECLKIFRMMQFMKTRIQSGVDCPIAAITSCAWLKDLCSGRALHCFCIKNNLHGETSVANSLMKMYGKIQKESYARKIFDQMENRDAVTWNTFMGVLLGSGKSKDALKVFDQMVSSGVETTSVTILVALSACAAAADLNRGEAVHNYVRDKGFGEDTDVSTALMGMYAKCGKLSDARRVFDRMHKKDLAAWNAMICCYGSHGHADEALELMEKMEEEGWSPNEITFTAVLSACSRAGLVEEGRRIFGKMGEFSLQPSRIHVTCMVDLLGRSGLLEEAEAMAIAEPAADGGVWGALLGACMIHGEVEMGVRAGKMAVALDPYNDGYYMVLSNLYSSEGKKDEADNLRKMMLSLGVRKTAGWSMTELESGRNYETPFSSYKEA